MSHEQIAEVNSQLQVAALRQPFADNKVATGIARF
jgi:hypothetical protein